MSPRCHIGSRSLRDGTPVCSTADVNQREEQPCIHSPLDGALGNAGGDPYAYHVFNREEALKVAKQAADACSSAAAFAFAQ